MKESAVESLRVAGLDDRGVLDLVHVIGFFAYANRLADGLGVDLEPSLEKRERPRTDS